MKSLFGNIRKFLKIYIITFIVSLAIGLGIFLAFFLLESSKFIGAMDGTGVAAAALAGLSILLWIGKMGAYDSMSYGFKQMFSSMFGRNPSKYNDFATYKQDKNTQRKASSKYYFVSLFVAAIFIIAFIVLYAIKPPAMPH